jgi:nitroreductase
MPNALFYNLKNPRKSNRMSNTKFVNGYPFIRYQKESFDAETMKNRSEQFYQWANKRRTCRDISDKLVSRSVIENLLLTASTAPSGAHKQPWTFCAVSNPEIKKKIREAAEEEERKSYAGRMGEEWLSDLAPIGTDWQKPFLEGAPWLIVGFRRSYEIQQNGHKKQNYYVQESCGIACGFLLAAIHHAGLVALTHTPSPMGFLCKILNRPENEKPFLLVPIGYPAEEAWVPDLKRKSLNEVVEWYE